MEGNLGLCFNKIVFKNVNDQNAFIIDNEKLINKIRNIKLADLKPEQLDMKRKFPENLVQSFTMETAGQGMLIGVGNSHGAGKANNEFKMGFHFDYSTGIPVLTGHSLKGRLRSFFPIAYKDKNAKKKLIFDRIKQDIKKAINRELNDDEIVRLEQAIFEGQIFDENEKAFKSLPFVKRDIFLGAFPSKSNHTRFVYSIPDERNKTDRDGNVQYNGGTPVKEIYEKNVPVEAGTFLFDDNLANHQHPLKDPVPLRFLKILNNVEITFQFMLNDEGGLNKVEKEKLFEYLLLTYGVGAKTTSGYGQFKKPIATESNTGYFPIVFNNFTPIQLVENDNTEITVRKKNFFNEDSSEKNKAEQKRRAEQNENFKAQKKESIKKSITSIEINKQYVGKVIDISNEIYKIKIDALGITLPRKMLKEAKKGISISLNKEYIITFSTIKEPLTFSVSEKHP